MVIWPPGRLLMIINHGEFKRNIGHTLSVTSLGAVSAIGFWFLPSHISVFSETAPKCNPTPHQVRFDILGEFEEPFAPPNPKKISSRRLTLTKTVSAFDIFFLKDFENISNTDSEPTSIGGRDLIETFWKAHRPTYEFWSRLRLKHAYIEQTRLQRIHKPFQP